MTVQLEYATNGRRDLILNRPEKRNALNAETVEAVRSAATSLHADDAARCVVLRGNGKVFSAGADIGEMASLTPDTAATFIDNLRAAIDAVYRIPIPVICQLHGVCVGGALELAAACDFRIAATSTTFSMPEVLVGIPSVIQAALLPRLIGHGRAGWFMLSGESIDTEKATAWGLIEKTVAPDRLVDTVEASVDQVLSADPAAVRVQKELLRSWDAISVNDAITQSIPVFASSFEKGMPQKIMSRYLKPKT